MTQIVKEQCSLSISHVPHMLPLHYEDHTIMMNVSLDTTNINAINISTLDFRIWQHFNSNWTPPHLQKLANLPEVPFKQIYKHLINTSEQVHSFTMKDDNEDPSSYGQS